MYSIIYLCFVSLAQVIATGAQIRPGMTVIRSPLQQGTTMGKTIIRTPLMMQQGILPASRSLLCRLPTCGCMALLTPQHAHYRQSATLLCVDMFIRIHFIRMDTIFRTVLVVRRC